MVSIMSEMLYELMGTTVECGSLVPCETHLPRVPSASSVQGGGPPLQHTSLVSLTTGENNQMYSHHKALHMYSIMYVECLQTLQCQYIINTCQIYTGLEII